MLACQPNYVGVSAGLVRIDKYLGSAMLTCMDRIEKGSPTSLKHNLPVHPDLLRLYRLRLGMRDEQLQVQLHTQGLAFTSANMIELWMENKRNYDIMRKQNLREREYRTKEDREGPLPLVALAWHVKAMVVGAVTPGATFGRCSKRLR